MNLTQMVSGHSPGIDGLSDDFYKHSWNILGPDFHQVLLECLQKGSLPTSCRTAVISLLPENKTSLF